jgi:glycosyltransferase involved in cell wall biosynthesis
VISFARGAAPELIVDGETGFLVPTLDEMVQCIPHLAEIDRKYIRTYVEQNFSARVMADHYLKVYDQLLSAPQKSQSLSS